ncbi:MAG: 4-hydroxy-tetrahydrodipicolinate reductase [Clostridia bacterium]|nr:4-hydroxy-tetrahydrodipicolinate reductase [Clostridia bacterium]
MTNVLICGIGGKMGQNVYALLQGDKEAQAVCGVDMVAPSNVTVPVYDSFEKVSEKVDVIVDFSSPKVLPSLLAYAQKTGCAVVLATTGYTPDDLAKIEDASKKIAVFKTANFSVGVNLLVKLVKQAAAFLGEDYDVEIVEKHHHLKVDAPSGTALMLADSVNAAFDGQKEYLYGRSGNVGRRGKEIGIHAVRGGTIVGEHDVLFCGEDEEITLSHRASSKIVFASGAVRAAKFVAGMPAGKYDMTDVLKNL